jgi:GAF domain-containing protein
MVVPLLEEGVAVGAIDFQSMEAAAFDLDDVAAAETLADFLVVALRNARLFSERGEAAAEARREVSE